MGLRDRAFQFTFSKTFVYNVLFEDSEVDARYLDVKEDSSILSISAAGCGVAGLMAARPRSLTAVDINHHHLALSALKVAASTQLGDYETFYELMGRGKHRNPEKALAPALSTLPGWIQRYWSRHMGRFKGDSLYERGLTARLLGALRLVAGLDEAWIRRVTLMPVADRIRLVEETLRPVFETPWVRALVSSPLQLLGLGINYLQRDRMLAASGTTMAGFIVEHFQRLATTDIERNWYVWLAAAGEFNHGLQDAVPPFLRRVNHERSLGAPTQLNFHHGSILDVLKAGQPKQWSHYTLCDAVDWMPEHVQQELFAEIERTARPGALVLIRSVEDDAIPVRLGLEKRFRRLDEASDQATLDDRSRQYRRVDFFQVAA